MMKKRQQPSLAHPIWQWFFISLQPSKICSDTEHSEDGFLLFVAGEGNSQQSNIKHYKSPKKSLW